MADQPQEGEDGAAPAAHGGVELEDPEVGGEVGAAQQDGHVLLWLRLVFTVGRRGHTGVGRGGRGWPGRRHRGAVGEGDHLTAHFSLDISQVWKYKPPVWNVTNLSAHLSESFSLDKQEKKPLNQRDPLEEITDDWRICLSDKPQDFAT